MPSDLTWVAGAITAVGTLFTGLWAASSSKREKEQNYALARQKQNADDARQVLTDVRQLNTDLAALNKSKDQEIKEKEDCIEEKEGIIRAKDHTIREKNERIGELEAEIQKAEEQTREAERVGEALRLMNKNQGLKILALERKVEQQKPDPFDQSV